MSIVPIGTSDVSKITSGQVIVDLTSVVKELVDNAVDSGADKIEITFENQGLNSLSVSDNGHGISSSDFAALCLKHHTSKLASFEDLASVGTLGFRGEAMSSLCAVAKVKVHTCSKSTFPRGTQLEYDAMGKLVSQKSHVSGKKGTTVTVTDLFHGLPVRQVNFVKHIRREYTKAVTVLQAYLLAYTHIRFTVFNTSATGKKSMVYGTQGGQSTVANVMTAIYKTNGAHGLIPVDIKVQDIDTKFKLNSATMPISLGVHVTGYVSDCSFGMGRSATDRQYISINKRPVAHKKIAKLVNEVYKTLNTTQSPVFVLNIQLDSTVLDVNVTPDKRLVMMQCEDVICDVIREELLAFYSGRNNIIPKSQMGAVHMGSSPQQSRLDSFRSDSSHNSFLSSSNDTRVIDKPSAGSQLEVTQIVLSPPADEVEEDVQGSGLFVAQVDDDEPESINSEDSGASEDEKGGENENENESDNGAGAEMGSENESVDDFEDVDADNLVFSSPLKPNVSNIVVSEVQYSSAGGEDDTPPEVFFVDHKEESYHETREEEEDSEIENEERGLESADEEENPETSHVQNELAPIQDIQDSSDAESEQETPSAQRPTSAHSQKENSMDIEEITILTSDTPTKEGTIDVRQFSQTKSRDHLQGTQTTLSLNITDAKSYLAYQINDIGAASNLASIQDISEAMEIAKSDFEKMEIVGQFNSGFIIVTHEGKLFIVDQHASDEIHNYERLMNNLTLNPQPLVVPEVLELSPIDEMKILEFTEHLGKNGFCIEEIADAPPGRRIRLVGIPVSKNVVFDVSDLHELVHKLHEQGSTSQSNLRGRCTKVDRMIASRACRSSIMIGQDLSSQTMTKVVRNLSRLDRPWNCPHGRPTMRHLADIHGKGFSADYDI